MEARSGGKELLNGSGVPDLQDENVLEIHFTSVNILNATKWYT